MLILGQRKRVSKGGAGSGNFGHGGRPGQVGGSGGGRLGSVEGPRESSVSIPIHPLSNPPMVLGGLEFTANEEVAKYLTKNGQEWQAQELPSKYSKMENNQCFMNASLLMLEHPELSYCEGIAYSGNLPKEMGFLHAWTVTSDGKVVDPTWHNPEKATYFGVKYEKKKYMAHLVKTKMYGVFGGSDKVAKAVLKRGRL